MVLEIQVAGSLFAVFMIYYSFLKYKRKEFTAKEFVLWLVLWMLLIVISLFPYILDPISKKLNFARNFDLLVIAGFLFLILAIFYTYTLAKKNQKQLEAVVREISIRKKK